MASKLLKVDNILLDTENPRISPSGNQREALQKIVDDQGSKLVALAKSIAQDGLNPMDRLLVIRAVTPKNRFIALEGNRRLAALKILNNPSLLGGLTIKTGLQKRFESVAASYDHSIKTLDCNEVESRIEAAMWIRLRHTGENKGRGIVDWGAVASARFLGTNPSLQALDLVLNHGELTADERSFIDDGFPISTLDRLLRNPAVRTMLGLSIRGDKLLSSLPPAELIKPLKRIVRALSDADVNVTALKLRDQQIAWVRELGDDLPDLSKASGAVKPVENLDNTDFLAPPPSPSIPPAAPQNPGAAKPRVNSKPKKKDSSANSLIPEGCSLTISNPKIDEIAGELRRLSISDFPHAVSVLFRVFLEQSVDDYLTKAGISLEFKLPNGGDKPKTLKTKVEEAVAEMVRNGLRKKDLDGLTKGLADKNSPLNMDTFNAYVHNRFYSPQERELRVSWNNAQLFFEKIWP